jgi:UDP-GlcNAc:undecaprenyl-phosphate GlcNAc-1-phosphate transferase
MAAILVPALVAFALCFVLTPVVRRWSLRYGAVDRPDSDRKLHRLPIPRTGGIAIALACAGGFLAFFLSPLSQTTPVDLPLIVGTIAAVLVAFVTGLIDDLVGLGAPAKFAGLIVAATCAYVAGVEVHGFAGFAMSGWWSLPVTVIWLVACANAFNLIDGVDGLAAGVGLVAALTTLFAALIGGNLPLAVATAPLVGALVAFLRYNFAPASMFLGDCGSLTIGFALGCCGAIWSQKATTLMGMTAPLMALSVPLVDTGVAVVRRFLRHQPLFHGDRNHIHHRLLDKGFGPRDVALALTGMAVLTATFALIQTSTGSRYGGVLVVALGALIWLAVRSLGYLEFTTARYLATSGVFRHVLDVHVHLSTFEGRLARAGTGDEVWTAVQEATQRFGFMSVQLKLGNAVYKHSIGRSDLADCCRTRIPLPEEGYVEFAHPNDQSVPRAIAINALGQTLQRVVGERAFGGPVASISAGERADVDASLREGNVDVGVR